MPAITMFDGASSGPRTEHWSRLRNRNNSLAVERLREETGERACGPDCNELECLPTIH